MIAQSGQKVGLKPLSGVAGVHFVAGELSRLGYIALVTTRNTQGIDLIVSRPDLGRTAYLQVKANKKRLISGLSTSL